MTVFFAAFFKVEIKIKILHSFYSGILSLSLLFLQMINLDGTKVTPDLNIGMMPECPKLTQMSMRNLEPFTRDDEIEEADMDI